MREKQTIEFGLRLFTLRVRLMGKRTFMQNKNFVDLTKNDATTSGNEKKKQKKELEQFLVQAQNPLKSIMQNMEKNLELTKISF